MDLVNTENLEPREVDITVLEESLFNNPDPYDLGETDRVDDELNIPDFVMRTSTHFEIRDIVQLGNEKLIQLITNVDIQGPGSNIEGIEVPVASRSVEQAGVWDVDSFFK